MSQVDLPVVVVGAGLSGLVAAWHLAEAGRSVALCEKNARVGGQIHTLMGDDGVVELGAEGFVARSQRLPALCRSLQLEPALIDQSTTLTSSLEGDVLRVLQPGEAARALGFQVPKEELGRGIRSLAKGMGQLTDRLAEVLRSRIDFELGNEVAGCAWHRGLWQLRLASGRSLEARGMVIATPARTAARLLADTVTEAGALARGTLLSNASATLVYEESDIGLGLSGSGFIVSEPGAHGGLRALSFISTKFPRPKPENRFLIRAFFRPTEQELAERSEEDWMALAHAQLAPILRLAGGPKRGWASVWPQALAVYDDAFRTIVSEADRALLAHDVVLVGSHYHGAGIDRAVASAESGVVRLCAHLDARRD